LAAVALIVLATAVVAAFFVRDSDDAQPTRSGVGITPTVPTPAATLEPVNGSSTRVPGVYTLIATPTPSASPVSMSTRAASPIASPSATPIADTPGIGSSRAELEAQFGQPRATEVTGEVVYASDGAEVVVLYSADDLALRMVFDYTSSAGRVPRGDIEDMLRNYRPRDAVLLNAGTPTAGVEMRVYTSASLAGQVAGYDTHGRIPNHYLEQILVDPAAGQVLSFKLALGDTP